MGSGATVLSGAGGEPGDAGYDDPMSETDSEPQKGRTDAERDLAEHERPQKEREVPDVGLVPDEDLPEDVRPSDDNPLAKDPDEDDDGDGHGDDGSGLGGPKVEGMPDVGNPGAPA
jgi:hypothetical protein